MANRVCVLVGTRKGAFIFESGEDRREWKLKGPFCQTWPMNHVIGDEETGTIFGGGGDPWFGPAVWKTTDLGETWTHSSEGLAYEEGQEPVASVWSVHKRNGTLYAGVQPAGLFRSDDGGQTWTHLDGLQKHPSRTEWHPGGAGLILHSLVTDPEDEQRIWIGISAAGVFHSADGGRDVGAAQQGHAIRLCAGGPALSRIGQCVHSIVKAPNSPRTFSTSRTIAACIAARMAASPGRASKRACPPPSAFRPPPIRAIPTRSSCCR
jgi:hypothetical protein